MTTAEELERILAKIPQRKPDELPPVPCLSDAPLSLASMGPLSPEAFGALPALPAEAIEAERARQEREARATWNARFDVARASIPERFAWVVPIRVPKKDEPDSAFVLPPDMAANLPWFRAWHGRQLRAALLSGRNVILSGGVGAGKTSLMVLLARWTLACAAYDAPAVRKRRDEIEAWRTAPRDLSVRFSSAPLDPEHLPEVGAASRLRFVAAETLLDGGRREPSGDAVAAACGASTLCLDAIGDEVGKENPGAYLTALRSVAVQTVIQRRWNAKLRWFATTEFGLDGLAERYDNGTLRRLVEWESGAAFINLNSDEWAGVYLKEKAARARAERSKR